MPGRRSGATKRRIKAGADSTVSKKPRPSSARKPSSIQAELARPPSTLASAKMLRPATMLRLRPALSAARPTKIASSMPAICTMDSKKPDCTKLMPKSACSAGKAGGSLPRCKAATMPPNTTKAAARPG
jgi:hypothetical protein